MSISLKQSRLAQRTYTTVVKWKGGKTNQECRVQIACPGQTDSEARRGTGKNDDPPAEAWADQKAASHPAHHHHHRYPGQEGRA